MELLVFKFLMFLVVVLGVFCFTSLVWLFFFDGISNYFHEEIEKLYKKNIDIKEYCCFSNIDDYKMDSYTKILHYEKMFSNVRYIYNALEKINKDMLLIEVLQKDIGNRQIVIDCFIKNYTVSEYAIFKYVNKNFNAKVKRIKCNPNSTVEIYF